MKTASQSLPAPTRPNQLAALEHRFGPIQHWPIDRLTNYAGNPRKHPEKQIVKLMASVSQFGFVFPVLVDEEGLIISGEARAEAARRLGMRELPVLVADQWSKAQIKAYRLADNRLAMMSAWDEDLLAIELAGIIELDEVPIELLGWDTAEIDVILEVGTGGASSVDPADQIPEPPTVPVSCADDLWLLGKHRLLCASSLDEVNWKGLMDGGTGAMAFVDFPYNVPVNGHVCGLGKVQHAEFAMASGEMSRPEFTAFLTSQIAQHAACLKDGAVLDLCMDWRHQIEILTAIEANNLSLLNICVWNKRSGGMGSLYRSKYELVLIARKGKASHVNNVELGKHGRYRTNVWDYAGVNTFGKTRDADLAAHPTCKPVALVADAIRDVTHPGEIVLDGCMGSGTTILAAERTKRVAYGIEIAPGYIDVAIHRWQAMTGGEAILAETGETFAEVAARRAADITTPNA